MKKPDRYAWLLIGLFLILAILSGISADRLQFSFDFDQFFPKGDPDLQFYEQFQEDFGSDDSFLLLAVENTSGVFNKNFLERFHQLTVEIGKMPHVLNSHSLTSLSYPLKTSLGYTALPVIHRKDSTRFASDWQKIKSDSLFLNTLVDRQAKSMVIAIETQEALNYKQSADLLQQLTLALRQKSMTSFYMIGRATFYMAIVDMQQREFLLTSVAALLLTALILFLIYRQFKLVAITALTVLTGLLLFLGFLSLTGQELNLMALFYPLLLVIVGTSDIVHILDAYLREVEREPDKLTAMRITLREVGISTLLTSLTTAAGFATLLFSRLDFIQDFGRNAAIGVMIMYATVILFTCPMLYLLKPSTSIWRAGRNDGWKTVLLGLNKFTILRPKTILVSCSLLLLVFVTGTFAIDTNYKFSTSLPQNSVISRDFDFFQEHYFGFRPFEVAVLPKKNWKATDYRVASEVEKVTRRMGLLPLVGNIRSHNTIFKVTHRAQNLNRQAFYQFPASESSYNDLRKDARRLAGRRWHKFVNKDDSKGRITANLLDAGSDSLTALYADLNKFIHKHTDSSVVNFRLTGKGLLLDKNAAYIRTSLLQGLVFALLLVCLLMGLLFRNVKLVLISLLPNVLPLLFSAAILGFLNIPLEATLSLVFAIGFGISVDDSIHFLTKYKWCLSRGLEKEEALAKTYTETGKALIVTTLVLICMFLILLFSDQQSSVMIGVLLSATMFIALLADLILLPVLIRKFL